MSWKVFAQSAIKIVGVKINIMHVNSVKISYMGMVGISVTGCTSALPVTYIQTIPYFLDIEIKFSNAMTFTYSRNSHILQFSDDQEIFIFFSHIFIYLKFYYIICMNLAF
jgi:hypothetical protein